MAQYPAAFFPRLIKAALQIGVQAVVPVGAALNFVIILLYIYPGSG